MNTPSRQVPDENDDLSQLRRRVLYICQHRGTKELDLVFGPFAVKHVAAMSDADLLLFAQLIEQSEFDLWRWLNQPETLPVEFQKPVVHQLINYAHQQLALDLATHDTAS